MFILGLQAGMTSWGWNMHIYSSSTYEHRIVLQLLVSFLDLSFL